MESFTSDNSSDLSQPNVGCFERMQAQRIVSGTLTSKGQQALDAMHVFQAIAGLIIGCGVLANSINIVVLLHSVLRQFTTNCFLLAIAVSDLLMLIVQIPHSLESTSGAVRRSNEFGYRQYTVARYGLTYILLTCSAWLLVAMVIEKILINKLTSRTNGRHTVILSNKTVHIIIGIISIASAIVHITKFAEFKPNPDLFSPLVVLKTAMAKTKSYELYTYIANLVLSIAVPMVCLILATAYFLYNVIKSGCCCNLSRSQSNESKVNLLMFCLSLCFIICNIIAVYFMFRATIPMKRDPITVQTMGILKTINAILVLGFAAFKIIIYLFFVQYFKETLKDLITCNKAAKYRLPPDGNTHDPTFKRATSDEGLDNMAETTCSFENPVYGTKGTE